MKVTEICSYYVDETRKSLAYYHTKIEGRNVIFRREMKPEVEPRGSYFLIRLMMPFIFMISAIMRIY